MAVTVEGTPTEGSIGGASSVTFSYTAGGDGLFVGVAQQQDINVTGVTFNGDAMTEKWDFFDDIVDKSTGYIMVAPDAGAHNVVVTVASSSDVLYGAAVGLTGLNQATPTRTAYTAAYDSNDPTVTVVDSQAGDLVIDFLTMYDNGAMTCDVSQTNRIEEEQILTSATSGACSTESATGANTVMSWTHSSGAGYWALGAMALVAAAAGGRTAMITRAKPLGVAVGMNFGVQY